jgi:hypothetical protein
MGLFLQRRSDRPLKLLRVVGREVGQLAVFRVTPARLDRIEFRSVSRQPLEFDVLDPRSGNPLGGGAMHLPTIPADDDWPTQWANGVLRLQRNIGNAISGTGTFGKTLGELGVDLQHLAALNPEQQLIEIADAISRVKDPAQQAALAQRAFGGAARDMLPLLKGGAEGMRLFREEGEKFGVTLSDEQIAAADALGDAWCRLT